MDAQKIKWPLLITGLFVVLFISLNACTQGQTSEPVSLVDIQAEINTAVAATVNAYVSSTQPAGETVSGSKPFENVLPVDTETPPPTATPIPTQTPQPTQKPTKTSPDIKLKNSSLPKIWAEVNTNCRLGPSKWYAVDGYLVVGATSYVHGRDTTKNWWYIENPTKETSFCWVWTQTTVVEGSTSDVPVVAAPPSPQKEKPKYWCGYYYGYPYYCNYPGCCPKKVKPNISAPCKNPPCATPCVPSCWNWCSNYPPKYCGPLPTPSWCAPQYPYCWQK